MTDLYDLVVIGSGPAGQSAAELAAFLGHSALIVEKGLPGGTVTTTGGAPTKTLREMALSLDGSRSRPDALEWLRARTLGVCRSLQSVTSDEIATRGIDYLQGRARLSAGRAVIVEPVDGPAREIGARAVVIATGSRPARFAGVAYDDPDIYDSDEIFTLQQLPPDIVVVGGGPVGVEFATVFTALDIPVTLIDPGERLLPGMDGELAELLAAEFARRGVRVRLGARVESAVRGEDGLAVTLSSGERLAASAVLFAAGRVANTEGLGLEEAGVEVDRRGRIVVDRYFQTTSAGVYAVGDAVGPTLASLAMQQGRAAICHAFGLAFGVPVDRAASAAVYGLPELAGVGATEEQVRASATPYVVGRCDLSRTARGAISGRGGRLKLIVRADDRKLLGVHCIGDIASELVGMGHAVIHAGGAVDIFLTLALNTPTFTAAYRDASIDALTRLAVLAGRGRSPYIAAAPPVLALSSPETRP